MHCGKETRLKTSQNPFYLSSVNILHIYSPIDTACALGLIVIGNWHVCVSLQKLNPVMLNPYAAGGYFGQYKMMQKAVKWSKPWHTGTHLRVLSESITMNTKITRFKGFSKNFASLCFGWKSPQHWKGYRVPPEIVAWIYDTYYNSFGIEIDFTKYLKESYEECSK